MEIEKAYRIFAINPGSTSTKIALFENDAKVFAATLEHDASELAGFDKLSEQLPYRREKILQALSERQLTLRGTDAFVGRGGGLAPLVSGTYTINDILLKHARECFAGVHPATLGAQLAYSFAEEFGGKRFVVNPPDVDEFCDLARITGIKGVYRESRIHALNQKEIAIRYAESIGRKYDSLNLIVAHIGGGISVTAHRKGMMVDSNDILNGDGPFAPTRCGSISVSVEIIPPVKPKVKGRRPGRPPHIGYREVNAASKPATSTQSYLHAMIYQIAKQVGAMVCVAGRSMR